MGRVIEAFQLRGSIVETFRKAFAPFVGETLDDETKGEMEKVINYKMRELIAGTIDIDWKIKWVE